MRAQCSGIVGSNPACVTMKVSLVRKAIGSHLIKATSLEKLSPVSGFCDDVEFSSFFFSRLCRNSMEQSLCSCIIDEPVQRLRYCSSWDSVWQVEAANLPGFKIICIIKSSWFAMINYHHKLT